MSLLKDLQFAIIATPESDMKYRMMVKLPEHLKDNVRELLQGVLNEVYGVDVLLLNEFPAGTFELPQAVDRLASMLRSGHAGRSFMNLFSAPDNLPEVFKQTRKFHQVASDNRLSKIWTKTGVLPLPHVTDTGAVITAKSERPSVGSSEFVVTIYVNGEAVQVSHPVNNPTACRLIFDAILVNTTPSTYEYKYIHRLGQDPVNRKRVANLISAWDATLYPKMEDALAMVDWEGEDVIRAMPLLTIKVDERMKESIKTINSLLYTKLDDELSLDYMALYKLNREGQPEDYSLDKVLEEEIGVDKVTAKEYDEVMSGVVEFQTSKAIPISGMEFLAILDNGAIGNLSTGQVVYPHSGDGGKLIYVFSDMFGIEGNNIKVPFTILQRQIDETYDKLRQWNSPQVEGRFGNQDTKWWIKK